MIAAVPPPKKEMMAFINRLSFAKMEKTGIIRLMTMDVVIQKLYFFLYSLLLTL